VSDDSLKGFVTNGLPKAFLKKPITACHEEEFKTIFQAVQKTELMNPSTRSVLTIGEEGLAKSIQRLGQIDFFSVNTRKPTICDHKPVVVEVAIARFISKSNLGDEQDQVQLLRFANRVPLQFDKAACAITQAVESVNWRSYGLAQSKDTLPLGPYVFAISVTSPFIKFKNASKETIDASEELVEEIRRALMQAGQKLSRHIKAESRAADLERKLAHIEKFGPILVRYLGKVVEAPKARIVRAEEGLAKLLGRDSKDAQKELAEAEVSLATMKAKDKHLHDEDEAGEGEASGEQLEMLADAKPATKKGAKNKGKRK
jgi:DNA topoisomerase-6 subunit B